MITEQRLRALKAVAVMRELFGDMIRISRSRHEHDGRRRIDRAPGSG